MKKKFLAVGLLLLSAFVTGIFFCRSIDMTYFLSKKDICMAFIEQNYFLSWFGFIALYAIMVMSTLPLTAVFTIVGGFLFGFIGGSIATLLGATLGALISFVFFKYFLGKDLHRKYEHKLESFNHEIKKYGARYLIIVHLIMVIPFFLINLFSALANVSLLTFLWTTLVGILPSTLLYSYAGSQLHYVDTLSDVFSWKILGAVAILIIFVLATILKDKIVHKKEKKRLVHEEKQS